MAFARIFCRNNTNSSIACRNRSAGTDDPDADGAAAEAEFVFDDGDVAELVEPAEVVVEKPADAGNPKIDNMRDT
jgi:hypothetical protein